MASLAKTTKAKRKIRDDKLQKNRTRKIVLRLRKLEEEGKIVQQLDNQKDVVKNERLECFGQKTLK